MRSAERTKLPRGLKKHIRREKARIRRETIDKKRAEELIRHMIQRIGA